MISLSSNLRLESLLDARHPGWFSPALARKDLRLAIDLAEETGVGGGSEPQSKRLDLGH